MPKFTDEEEKEIELALEVKRRFAKETSEARKKEEEQRAATKWDGKTERRAQERRKPVAKKEDVPANKPSLFRRIA